jgi:hypothetical protein
MLAEVEIHLNTDREHCFSEKEDAQREFALLYYTNRCGEDAAEEAFHISNAPDELLSAREKNIKLLWKGRSLSVGDLVIVTQQEDEVFTQKQYLCCSCGWKEI